mgnify:CR=1 FL=1
MGIPKFFRWLRYVKAGLSRVCVLTAVLFILSFPCTLLCTASGIRYAAKS